jgi:hypothetical protein
MPHELPTAFPMFPVIVPPALCDQQRWPRNAGKTNLWLRQFTESLSLASRWERPRSGFQSQAAEAAHHTFMPLPSCPFMPVSAKILVAHPLIDEPGWLINPTFVAEKSADPQSNFGVPLMGVHLQTDKKSKLNTARRHSRAIEPARAVGIQKCNPFSDF